MNPQTLNYLRRKATTLGAETLDANEVTWLIRALNRCVHALSFYSVDEFYDAKTFTRDSPIQIPGETVKMLEIRESPIQYDHGKQAREMLMFLGEIE